MCLPQVRPYAAVFRVHKLFTLLGLRHVPVVDKGDRLVGVITRKDLLPHVLSGHHAPHEKLGRMPTGEEEEAAAAGPRAAAAATPPL